VNDGHANAALKLDAPFMLDALRHEQDLLLRLIDANQQCFAYSLWKLSSALGHCLTTRRDLRDGVISVPQAYVQYQAITEISASCDLALAVAAGDAAKDRRAAGINDWLLAAQENGYVWLDGDTWELTETGYTHYSPIRDEGAAVGEDN
jgi:hypothetical protein